MPLQNRVLPTGEIVTAAWRGTLMGNRGCLHDAEGRLGRTRWRHRAWIACCLSFRGRRRAPMPPGRYTALFFRDEAVALAAGHRPCAECRREAFRRFVACWQAAGLPGHRAAEIDVALHDARLGPDRRQRRDAAATAGLPPGTFILADGVACRIGDAGALPFDPASGDYGPAFAPPARAPVLTPWPIVQVLAAGYALAPPGEPPGPAA